ncbi:RHS repeat domain-containing protein [Saccharicrinis aurantiacus]|uniref:hypothetical protein n=1 Tax=Saccharicrinis aurantiacus TaxID=1849719 RepID=UPI00094F9258|nr:hypothetical protein [Saccharicrinis aurantiacus]
MGITLTSTFRGLLRFVLPSGTNSDEAIMGNPSTKIITGHETLNSEEKGVSSYIIGENSSLTLLPGFEFIADSNKSLHITKGAIENTPGTFANTSDPIKLMYSYKYDVRKRITEKKKPGSDPVYIVYDNRDRLVATQDGEMRDPNGDGNTDDAQGLFTKYDAINRPVITGILDNGIATQAAMQTVIDDFYDDSSNLFFEQRNTSNTTLNYTSNSFPNEGVTADNYLTITFYDIYGFANFKPFISSGKENISGENSAFVSVKGQVTGTKTKVLDAYEHTADAQWITSTNYYDDNYRVIQAISDLYNHDNVGDNYSITCFNYDFVGKVNKTYQKQVFEGSIKTVEERFEYDYAGRLLENWHSYDGNPEVLITHNSYNEIGELITKRMGGSTDVACKQAMDYKYNIRGWLTQINDPDDISDLKRQFGMRLHYNSQITE